MCDMSSAVNGNYLGGGWRICFSQLYMLSQQEGCANNLKLKPSTDFKIGWLKSEF